MLEHEHETLTAKKENLRSRLNVVIDEWEKSSGIYVKQVDYFKNRQMKKMDIVLTLRYNDR